MEEKIAQFIHELIGKKANNIALYVNAFTHKSIDSQHNYEELEFLGDRVYGFVISEYVYNCPFWKDYHVTVKDLHNCFASFTHETAQATIFDSLKIKNLIRYEGQNGLSDKTKADFLEAIIGAIYIDNGITKGIKVARKVIEKWFLKKSQKQMIPMFVTKKEDLLRKKLLLKKKKLIIEYKQGKKEWYLRATLGRKHIKVIYSNIVQARDDLIDTVSKLI